MKSIFTFGAVALLTTIHLTPVHAAATNTTAAAAAAGNFTGKVVETMDAATYTYALIDTGAAKAWVAAPQFIVKTGDTLAVADAMPMNDYRSKTLSRTEGRKSHQHPARTQRPNRRGNPDRQK